MVSILNNQAQSQFIRNKELHYAATGKQNRSKKKIWGTTLLLR